MRTGLTSPSCYAAPLADCDGDAVTREHYISRSLLRRFGKGIWVDGLAWLKGPKQLSEKSLVSRILCKRHNNALTELDTMIGEFYDVLSAAHAGRDVGWRSFEGHLFERWAVKILCGLLASGNMGGPGSPIEIPVPYLRLLFGEVSVIDGAGFYYIGDPIDGFDSDRLDVGLMFVQPPAPDAGKVYGVVVKLLGFAFLMSVTARIDAVDKQRVWHRPRGLILGEVGSERGCVALRWGYSGSNQVLRIKFDRAA